MTTIRSSKKRQASTAIAAGGDGDRAAGWEYDEFAAYSQHITSINEPVTKRAPAAKKAKTAAASKPRASRKPSKASSRPASTPRDCASGPKPQRAAAPAREARVTDVIDTEIEIADPFAASSNAIQTIKIAPRLHVAGSRAMEQLHSKPSAEAKALNSMSEYQFDAPSSSDEDEHTPKPKKRKVNKQTAKPASKSKAKDTTSARSTVSASKPKTSRAKPTVVSKSDQPASDSSDDEYEQHQNATKSQHADKPVDKARPPRPRRAAMPTRDTTTNQSDASLQRETETMARDKSQAYDDVIHTADDNGVEVEPHADEVGRTSAERHVAAADASPTPSEVEDPIAASTREAETQSPTLDIELGNALDDVAELAEKHIEREGAEHPQPASAARDKVTADDEHRPSPATAEDTADDPFPLAQPSRDRRTSPLLSPVLSSVLQAPQLKPKPQQRTVKPTTKTKESSSKRQARKTPNDLQDEASMLSDVEPLNARTWNVDDELTESQIVSEVQRITHASSSLQQRRMREMHQRVAAELNAVPPLIADALQQIVQMQSDRSQQSDQDQDLVEQIMADVSALATGVQKYGTNLQRLSTHLQRQQARIVEHLETLQPEPANEVAFDLTATRHQLRRVGQWTLQSMLQC